jgi:RNA polymerase sigma-70 factor, ECF subfamily
MKADLIQRAQQGDHAAFEEVIRAAYDRLYAIAYRILRERLSAEDAVQDAIVRCWRDLRALRDPDRFDGWLHRLLVNACRDQARRSRRRPMEVYGHPIDLPARGDEYARVAAHDELERAFLKLPADQRIALVLTHYVGYSAAELAGILGVPAGTVHSRLHYGARAMRAALAGPKAPHYATSETAQ